MCVVATTMTAIGTAIGVAAKIYSSSTQQAVYGYNTKLSLMQAQRDERNAAYERQQGIEDARQQKLDAIKNMGRIKTNIASGNLSLSSETSLSLIDDEKEQGELDSLNTMNIAERRAKSYEESMINAYNNASLISYKAKRQRISDIL